MPHSSPQLFELVQLLRLWDNSKTFPDLLPVVPADQIEAEFQAFLENFFQSHSDAFKPGNSDKLNRVLQSARDALYLAELARELKPWVEERYKPQAGLLMEQHIQKMWDVLIKPPSPPISDSTRIPLDHPFVVAGGRYLEAYYWDSYFTCLGLLDSTHSDTVRSVAANFASLIRRFGYVPNGTRTYYIGRSQPPFFSLILRLLDPSSAAGFLDDLIHEHDYWMDCSRIEAPAAAPGRKTVLLGGDLLNRYWDVNTTPRPEGYWEDVHTALSAGKPAGGVKSVYRHLRAAAEFGFDFSSRWLVEDPTQLNPARRYPLSSIRTTDILPIDLNALLFSMEQYIATRSRSKNITQQYRAAAAARKAAVLRHFWDEDRGWFFDCDTSTGQRTPVWSLAGVYPLFCGMLDAASPREYEMASRVKHNILDKFLQPGGVVTSLHASAQQWDWPNGWAPLQWIAVIGLVNYGFDAEAREIARRFVDLARRTYTATGKMMEKYDVCDLTKPGGGGEYPNQDGFGWTNGVVTAFCEYLTSPEDSVVKRVSASLVS